MQYRNITFEVQSSFNGKNVIIFALAAYASNDLLIQNQYKNVRGRGGFNPA